MSVRTGKPSAADSVENAQAFLQTRSPILDTLLRLALSKDALKTNGPAISPIACAIRMHVLFAFDDARPGNQGERRADSKRLPWPDLDPHGDDLTH